MGVGSVAHGRTYTAEEVARLASNGADLLICDGLVVDFSAFTHPGGRAVLTRHAGEDVSDMFRGIAGTQPRSSHKPMAHMRSDAHAHSAAAFSMLTRLAVGTIDATAASETGAEEEGPFARVRARRAQLAMHAAGAEGADTAVDDEKGGIRSGLGSTVDTDASSSDLDPSGSEEDEREPGDTSGVDLPGKHHPDTSDTTDFGIDRTRALVHQVGSLGTRYHEWVHTPEVSDAPLRFFENDWAEVSLFYFSYGQLV